LPVIDCASDPTTCAPLVGAVGVYVIWVTQQPNYKDLPTEKSSSPDGSVSTDWNASTAQYPAGTSCSGAENPDKCIWYSFADHFNLLGAEINPETDDYTAAYQAKTIYFLNTCDDQAQEGLTGGKNFGILAKIPVLVD
jgi:hypothetical protein